MKSRLFLLYIAVLLIPSTGFAYSNKSLPKPVEEEKKEEVKEPEPVKVEEEKPAEGVKEPEPAPETVENLTSEVL